jgi:hypothetical protein
MGVFISPKDASAQFGQSTLVYDTATAQVYGLNKSEDIFRIGVVGAAMTGLISAVNFMAQKIAYDTAEQISEGNIGKAPLFDVKNWGNYSKDLLDQSFGYMLEALNESGLAPFNLCDPGNLSLNISLALGWVDAREPKLPASACSFSQFKNNYKNFAQRVKTGEALKQFSIAFEPAQSPLGVAVDSSSRVAVNAANALNAGIQARIEGQGFISVGDSITGKVQTPAQLVREKALEGAKTGKEAQGISYDAMGKALVAAPGVIALGAANTFINHLVAKLLTKVLQGGLYYTLADATCALGITGCGGLTDYQYGSSAGTGAFRAQNTDLITPPLQADSHYQPLEEFATCPDQFRTVNNCVIDSQLAASLSRGTLKGKLLTVQEAMDQGYLHPEWPLISNSEVHRARNADPYCFTNAYCYSNLVKLRKHRILPIGWELAAAKSKADPVKLGEVVSRFNDCPTAADPNPNNHPWCHLIDPNWVLKLPVTQCRLRVNGATLLSDDAPGRAQTCVDTPSCLAEDQFGNCVGGYGYCAKDKNIWRLGGRECKAPYASCASFSGRTGENLLALQNTIDHGICTADNVGCLAYHTSGVPATSTEWSYNPGTDRVFLNKNVASCDAEDAGCTRVIDKEGLRRNLVLNPGFEEDTAPNGNVSPKYWSELGWPTNTLWLNDASVSHSGSHVIQPAVAGNTPASFTRLSVPIEPDMTYTVSFYYRSKDVNAPGSISLFGYMVDTEGVPYGVDSSYTTCLANAPNGLGVSVNGFGITQAPPADASWARATCTFVTMPNGAVPPGGNGKVDPSRVVLAFSNTANGSEIYVDDVQIEEGASATAFHDSLFEGGTALTYKMPPTYLGCTGDKTIDPAACANYAPVCMADEVGCDRYTPEAGGAPITAITASEDACPEVCVGYETFRKEPSAYDVEAYPKYFIPTTATQCSAAAAGCTEFTNLDAQAAGGEAREYFTDLRLCEKPSGITPTYYTWEGSDTTGYQLKEWHLKSGLPIAGAVDPEVGTPPEVIQPYDVTLCSKAIFQAANRPDCREFFDVNGNVSYRLYAKTIVITDDCHPYRITTPPVREDVTQQAQCANDHWLLGSNTCVVCEGVGGVWNGSDGSCLFQGYKQESTTCGAKENGCRLYTGNAGANVEVVMDEGFESTVFAGWAIDGTTVATSTESTIVGGHSLRVDGNAAVTRRFDTTTGPVIDADGVYMLEFWAKGGASTFQYISLIPVVNPSTPSFVVPSDAQDVDGNWHFYSVGPVKVQSGDLGGSVVLSFSTNLGSGQFWYLDNVVLKKVGSAIAVVKDSWKTPLVCDQTANGTFLPQAQLGCASYTDRKSEQHALKSFDRLCRDAAVGCRAFLNTQNNDFGGYEYWNATAMTGSPVGTPTGVTINQQTVCTVATKNSSCRFHTTSSLPPSVAAGTSVTCTRTDVGPCYVDGIYMCTIAVVDANNIGTCTVTPSDLVTIPPDKTQYVVEDDAFVCDASQAGCTETGVPTGAVCALDASCSPQNNATSCPCTVQQEVCLPGQACTLEDQYVCDVAAGQTTCTFALPNKEPYPGLTYNTKTVILNPNLYDRQICTGNAVGCESWSSANLNAASVSYFKSPDGRLCEYREGVQIGSATYSGYFVQGTDTPCDPTFLINGNYYGIRKNADSNYQGYVGICPADQAGCTEYIDPVDYKARGPQSTLFDATRYYYIKDKNIDYTSCNGQASQKDGCVLMNDTSDLNLYYNAVGTYNDSTEQQYKSVPTKPGVCQYVIGCHQSSNVFADWDGADVQIPAGGFKAGWARFGGGATFGDLTQETNGSHNATFYAEGITTADADTLCVDNNLKAGSIWYQERGCNTDADCPSIAGVNGFCKSVQQANAVIKVARDRICGEWFACKSSTPQWDPRANRFRDTCDEVGLCDQQSDPATTSGSTDITSCKHWITDPAEQQILSEAAYQDRSISWTGLEYSGYSIPHQFPASALTQATTGRYCAVLDGNGNKIACKSAADCPAVPNGPAHAPCQTEGSLAHDVGICDVNDGGYCHSVCGAITDFPKRVQCVFEEQSAQHPADGKCYSHRCYQSPFGSTVAETFDQPQPLDSQATLALSCRAYPESDSPVPEDVVTQWNTDDSGLPAQIKQGFQNANVCLNGQDCECNYQKVLYGQAGKRYTGLNDDISQSIPGVCSGGTYDGLKCDPYIGAANLMKKRISSGIIQNLSCTTVDVDSLDQSEGKCLPVKQNNYVRGLQGYCLERDEVTPIYGRQDSSPNLPGRACLTWFPVDRVSGQPDIYNQYTSATYELRDSYQCLVPQLYKVVHTFGEGNDNSDVGPQGGEEGSQYVVSDLTGQGLWVGCAGRHYCVGANCDDIRHTFPDTDADYTKRATGNLFLDCPPSTGFLVVSNDPDDNQADPGKCPTTNYNDDDHNYLCRDPDAGPDNNFRYFCVPWGSVHTSQANGQYYGQECKPSDLNGLVTEYQHGPCGDPQWPRVNGGFFIDNQNHTLCDTDYLPKFDAKYWDTASTPIQYGLVTGDRTPVLLVNDKLCSNEVLGRMSDCWKIDVPVTGTQEEPYWGATHNAFVNGNPHADVPAFFGGSLPPMPTYLGCSVLAQVSKAGSSAEDTNKAYSNHLGGSQGGKPPGGDAPIQQANSPDVAAYTFNLGLNSVAIDPAYGGGSARGLDLLGLQWPVSSMYANQPKTGVLAPYVFIGSGGNICDAGGTCYNYGVDAADKYNFGMTSLHQIFTKAYNFLGWSYYPTSGKSSKGYVDLPEYTQSIDSSLSGYKAVTTYINNPPDKTKTELTSSNYPEFANLWSDTSTGNVSPQHSPKVVGVGTCDVDNHCYEDPNTSLNINGLSYGDIVGGGGWKRATFKFFAYAGLDADPIRDVRVIWDVKSHKVDAMTGNSGKFPGLYKNHRGFENFGGVQTAVCGNGSDFGTTPEACDDSAPFTFVHNYTCNEASPHCEDGSDSCWNPNYVLPGENVGKPACVYNPGVYVLNNWGVCLGTCGTAPGGILCSTNGGSSETIDNASAFADPNADDLDECTLKSQNISSVADGGKGNQPYIKYSGNIVVYPEVSN